jgi:putative addiction module CopG family antidote
MVDTLKTLAEPAREWIASQVASGAWPNAEAYLDDLVTRDRDNAEQLAALNAALDEGDTSEDCGLTIEEIFTEARKRHLGAKA